MVLLEDGIKNLQVLQGVQNITVVQFQTYEIWCIQELQLPDIMIRKMSVIHVLRLLLRVKWMESGIKNQPKWIVNKVEIVILVQDALGKKEYLQDWLVKYMGLVIVMVQNLFVWIEIGITKMIEVFQMNESILGILLIQSLRLHVLLYIEHVKKIQFIDVMREML